MIIFMVVIGFLLFQSNYIYKEVVRALLFFSTELIYKRSSRTSKQVEVGSVFERVLFFFFKAAKLIDWLSWSQCLHGLSIVI